MTRGPVVLIAALIAIVPSPVLGQGGSSTPGETSAPELAPLLVTGHDAATGRLQLTYQSGCGASNNNIYSGPLVQGGPLVHDSASCGVGTGGFFDGYDPGQGSRFFVIVGNSMVARRLLFGQSVPRGRTLGEQV